MYRYFSYFLSHGLIITMTILMALAGGVRITWRSLVRAFVLTNILLVPVYAIDQALRLIPPYDPGNYFVLGYPRRRLSDTPLRRGLSAAQRRRR